MGCDIHLSVERKNPLTGCWELVSPEGLAPQTDWEKKNNRWDWYGGRNYGLFSILANVRNGYGFGGVDTGDGYRPISKPKGVPVDASAKYKKEVNRWGVDGHSHSYLTLQDLLDYDWEQVTVRRGLVGALEFFHMLQRGDGKPQSWCGGYSGPKVSLAQMEKFVRTTAFINTLQKNVQHWEESFQDEKRLEWRKGDQERLTQAKTDLEMALLEYEPELDAEFQDLKHSGFGPMVPYEWRESYKDVVGSFLETTLPALMKLGDSNSVRIVFFFDN